MTIALWIIVLFVMPVVMYFALKKDEERGRKIIVDLLKKHGEMYGLQIIDASNGFFSAGNVYPLLRKMKVEGELASRIVHENCEIRGPRPIVYYRLSGSPRKRTWRTFLLLPA